MNGILLFGWSTAVIFEEVPTTVRNVRLLAWPRTSAAERLAYFFSFLFFSSHGVGARVR